jgi:hypothetical protein
MTEGASVTSATVNAIDQDQAVTELGRFLTVAATRLDKGEPTPMFCPYIDQVWHNLVGRPAMYKGFAMKWAGRLIGHAESSGYGEISWVTDYEYSFGQLPDIWFTDASGAIDHASHEESLRTGQI